MNVGDINRALAHVSADADLIIRDTADGGELHAVAVEIGHKPNGDVLAIIEVD